MCVYESLIFNPSALAVSKVEQYWERVVYGVGGSSLSITAVGERLEQTFLVKEKKDAA